MDVKKELVLIPGFSMETPEKRLGELFPFLHEHNIKFGIIRYLWKVVAEKSLVGWNLDKAVEAARTIIEKEGLDGAKNAFIYSYGLTVASRLELNFDTMVFYAPVFGPGTVIYRDKEKKLLTDPEHFPGFTELENEKFWHEIYAGLARYKEKGTKMTFLVPPENNGFYQDGRIKYTKKDIERMKIFGEVKILPEATHYIEGKNLKVTLKALKPSFF